MVRSAVGLGIGLAMMTAWHPVAAQTQSQRGARNVEVLGLEVGTNVSTSDLPEEQVFPGASDLPQLNSRFHSDVQAALRYQPIPGDRLNYGINLQSAVRRYESSDEFVVLGHSLGGHMGLRAGRRLSLSTYASGSYLPSYGLNMTPAADAFAMTIAAVAAGQLSPAAAAAGLLPASAVDYSLTKRTMTSVVGGGTIQSSLTRRLDLQVAYQHQRQAFRRDGDPDLRWQQAAGRLTYRLNRFLGLRMGFQRRYADYSTVSGVETIVLDDVDAGLESGYGRQVNLTRSTSLTFNTGSTFTHRNDRLGAQLTGSAYLAQRIGRRGEATFGFTRGTQLREGFDEPVFLNSFTAGVGFNMFRGVQFTVGGAGAVGRILGEGNDVVGDEVRSYQGSARLSYSFVRGLHVYGQYLMSGHDVGAAVGLIDGVPRNHWNRSLRAGVQWSVTLASQRRPATQAVPADGEN
jgi:hypothetical protein